MIKDSSPNLSLAVARTTPSRMKHPNWLSNIGTFDLGLDSDIMDQIEEMRDALPENHDLDQLTSRMSSLFSSPETSLRTSPTSAGAAALPSPLTVVSPLTASVWSPTTDIYMPPQRRLLQQGTTRSEMSSPLSDTLSTASSGIQEKTILCKFFQKGVCSKGDGCTFAHGISDIKAARSGRSRDTDPSNPRRKTKLCRNLFGEWRKYSRDVRNVSDLEKVAPQSKLCRQYFRPVRSFICSFSVDGICPYGDNCDFAHGVNDLKCTATAAAADEQGNVDLSQLIQLPELRQVSDKNYKTKVGSSNNPIFGTRH